MKLSEVKWENYLSKEDLPLPSPEDIHRLELEIGVKLPDDYKETLLNHQYQVPGEMVIKVGNSEEPIGCLYHIFDDSPYPSYGLKIKRKKFTNEGINHLIPFTDNTAGSRFCFDYSKDTSKPCIVFFNNDYEITDKDGIIFVADSFTDFFDLAEE